MIAPCTAGPSSCVYPMHAAALLVQSRWWLQAREVCEAPGQPLCPRVVFKVAFIVLVSARIRHYLPAATKLDSLPIQVDNLGGLQENVAYFYTFQSTPASCSATHFCSSEINKKVPTFRSRKNIRLITRSERGMKMLYTFCR